VSFAIGALLSLLVSLCLVLAANRLLRETYAPLLDVLRKENKSLRLRLRQEREDSHSLDSLSERLIKLSESVSEAKEILDALDSTTGRLVSLSQQRLMSGGPVGSESVGWSVDKRGLPNHSGLPDNEPLTPEMLGSPV